MDDFCHAERFPFLSNNLGMRIFLFILLLGLSFCLFPDSKKLFDEGAKKVELQYREQLGVTMFVEMHYYFVEKCTI